jgi:hypothetical protein
MTRPIQVASPINTSSTKKQVIELVVECISENYFTLSFHKQKDKLVQPYVAPLFAVYKEETKQALYNGLHFLGVYSRHDDSQQAELLQRISELNSTFDSFAFLDTC